MSAKQPSGKGKGSASQLPYVPKNNGKNSSHKLSKSQIVVVKPVEQVKYVPRPRPPPQKEKVARFRNVGSVTDLKKEIDRFRAQSRVLDQLYVASVLDPQHGQGARVPSKFPVLSTANHFHQTMYLKSSSTGDMVMAWNPGASYAAAAPVAYNQPFRYWASATIMTEFTAGLPFTNGATNYLNNPMNTVNFIEDSRVVSCSLVFTYTGPPLTASGSFNAAWFQYSIQSNNVLKRSGVDLAPTLIVGPATQGFRTIWTPRDVDDTVFRK